MTTNPLDEIQERADAATEAVARELSAMDDPLGNWKMVSPGYRGVYRRRAQRIIAAAYSAMEAQVKAEAVREVESLVDGELQDAPPSNYEEDNYDAGYIAGLTFTQDLLRARTEAIESAVEGA